jgi:hypothetical protein
MKKEKKKSVLIVSGYNKLKWHREGSRIVTVQTSGTPVHQYICNGVCYRKKMADNAELCVSCMCPCFLGRNCVSALSLECRTKKVTM